MSASDTEAEVMIIEDGIDYNRAKTRNDYPSISFDGE